MTASSLKGARLERAEELVRQISYGRYTPAEQTNNIVRGVQGQPTGEGALTWRADIRPGRRKLQAPLLIESMQKVGDDDDGFIMLYLKGISYSIIIRL